MVYFRDYSSCFSLFSRSFMARCVFLPSSPANATGVLQCGHADFVPRTISRTLRVRLLLQCGQVMLVVSSILVLLVLGRIRIRPIAVLTANGAITTADGQICLEVL